MTIDLHCGCMAANPFTSCPSWLTHMRERSHTSFWSWWLDFILDLIWSKKKRNIFSTIFFIQMKSSTGTCKIKYNNTVAQKWMLELWSTLHSASMNSQTNPQSGIPEFNNLDRWWYIKRFHNLQCHNTTLNNDCSLPLDNMKSKTQSTHNLHCNATNLLHQNILYNANTFWARSFIPTLTEPQHIWNSAFWGAAWHTQR